MQDHALSCKSLYLPARYFGLRMQCKGFQMCLYTNATLSGPLQQLVDSGIIRLYPLG